VSMCWPLLLAQAGMGRERPAAAVGGVSAIGYLGFVVGPAVVGSVAQLAGLRAGLLALAAAAVFVAVAPARVEARRSQARGHAVSPRESPLPRPAPPPSPPRP
jgi:MFS family permease